MKITYELDYSDPEEYSEHKDFELMVTYRDEVKAFLHGLVFCEDSINSYVLFKLGLKRGTPEFAQKESELYDTFTDIIAYLREESDLPFQVFNS